MTMKRIRMEVLGTGCPKCRKLAENAEEAARQLGVEHEIEKVTEIDKIMTFGVMMTPALAVDGEVKAAGKIPSVEEIRKMLA